ncbi:MAG: hypothetical protein Q7R59_00920 [bacterium]|nr:hypothetical protein [bacterium]
MDEFLKMDIFFFVATLAAGGKGRIKSLFGFLEKFTKRGTKKS